MANIKCDFTSIWSDVSEITTPCEYNPETGEVFPESVDTETDGCLEYEYITFDDGTELIVCPECHEYIMKYGICHNGMPIIIECKGPDCKNKR